MPTNLPPEYFEVEKRYKAAQEPDEKAELLEELLSTIPKHKGTDKLRADLRERLSKLKAAAQARKKISRQESAFHIDKEGAGQVAVIGLPNVGKSSLVAALTNAKPAVADHPYTTWTPTPGMLQIEDIQVQLVDTPPLDKEYIEPELANLVRKADLLLLMVDLQDYPLEQFEDAIAVLEKYKIYPEPLKDRLSEDRKAVIKPIIVLLNKADDPSFDDECQAFCELVGVKWHCLSISLESARNIEAFKQALFQALDIIRIYSKPPGKDADLNVPYVMKKGSTIADLAVKVHRDFYDNLKSARIWGSGVFDGQPVGREHVLQDKDIVELRV